MEESMIESFKKVRAIVDEKLNRLNEKIAFSACSEEGCSKFEKRSGEGKRRNLISSRENFPDLINLAEARRLLGSFDLPSTESHRPNLRAVNLSFAARVIIMVRDRFNGEASSVYLAANLSRQTYSQIISDETRPVTKRTAIRFAFALHSTPEEARLLLKSAGYAFSNSQTEDLILQACLEVDPPIWNLSLVNELLREYNVSFQY
jgi:hypothetical protein